MQVAAATSIPPRGTKVAENDFKPIFFRQNKTRTHIDPLDELATLVEDLRAGFAVDALVQHHITHCVRAAERNHLAREAQLAVVLKITFSNFKMGHYYYITDIKDSLCLFNTKSLWKMISSKNFWKREFHRRLIRKIFRGGSINNEKETKLNQEKN